MTHLEQEAIRTNLAVLLEPSGVYEMRVIGTRQATRSGYFKDIGEMAMVAANQNGDGLGPFITLNPVKPDLLARANGVLKPWAKHTTANADILRRRFIPIDLDAERSAGISSTEAEHDKARARAFMVFEFLSSEGVPLDAMVVADSGNGGHVLVRVDLPNDDDATALVRNLLSALHSKFSDEVVKVDTTSSNAARIWRVYGTVNNKGDSIPDRPHRMTSILRKPEALAITPVDILEKLAAMAPNKGGGGRRVSGDRRGRGDPGRGSEPGDLKGWLDEHGLVVTKEKHLGNGITYSLGTCPYSDAHDDGAWATQFDTGTRNAGCHHNSCAGKGWRTLRELVDGSTSFSLTDLGNAERLVAGDGQDIRYSHALKSWMVWDGRLWGRDDTGEIVRRAKDTVRTIYSEVGRCADKEERDDLLKHIRYSESAKGLRAMVDLAESEPGVQIAPKDCDLDSWLLNVLNGTLDLRTGELLPHRREHLLTKLVEVEYDPDARCPRFLKFLHQIMAGRPEMVRYLQRVLGYALTGDISEQALWVFNGEGANGKSTLMNLVSNIIGVYGAQPSIDTFLAHKFRPQTQPGLMALQGIRLAVSTELEPGNRLSEDLIKRVTGGEKITGRRLYENEWTYEPQFKLIMVVNALPDIKGTDHAIWRRVKRVPFTVRIPEAEQDKNLAQKLKDELPGVLAWLVRGIMDWQEHGLAEPADVAAATREYRDEQDLVAGFIEDRCIVDEGQQAATDHLYESFLGYCKSIGKPPDGKTGFGSRLRERGFAPVRIATQRSWKGVGLRPAPLATVEGNHGRLGDDTL